MATIQVAVNEIGRRIGHDHHRAKLTNGEVEIILELREEGWSYLEIAKKFEINKGTVRDIVKGRRRAQFAVAFRTVCITD